MSTDPAAPAFRDSRSPSEKGLPTAFQYRPPASDSGTTQFDISMSNAQPGDVSTMNGPPTAQVVLLGASNVTLGFPRILAALRRVFGGNFDVFAAHGHGRRFGGPSWVPVRTLPGIRDCGLWAALEQSRASLGETAARVPLYALVTDIGNDLVFNSGPDEIIGWVEECLARLRDHGARLTIGRLPLESVTGLGRLRFNLTRSLFFPFSRLTHERVRIDAPRLDELVAETAIRFGAATFQPDPGWYGFDPIHIRRASRAVAWQGALSQWSAGDFGPALSPGIRESLRSWRIRPAERQVLGVERRSPQPAPPWSDGTRVWLY